MGNTIRWPRIFKLTREDQSEISTFIKRVENEDWDSLIENVHLVLEGEINHVKPELAPRRRKRRTSSMVLLTRRVRKTGLIWYLELKMYNYARNKTVKDFNFKTPCFFHGIWRLKCERRTLNAIYSGEIANIMIRIVELILTLE